MIFVDIETTGIDRQKCDILSIGAIHHESGEEFYAECTPYPNALIDERALAINGFKKENIFLHNVTSIHAVYQFIDFAWKFSKHEILAGYNLGSFDCLFLHKAYDGTFNMTWPFGKRFVDVHSLGYFVFGQSLSADDLSLKLGIMPEEKPHNALNGARHVRKLYISLKSHNPFLDKI